MQLLFVFDYYFRMGRLTFETILYNSCPAEQLAVIGNINITSLTNVAWHSFFTYTYCMRAVLHHNTGNVQLKFILMIIAYFS